MDKTCCWRCKKYAENKNSNVLHTTNFQIIVMKVVVRNLD